MGTTMFWLDDCRAFTQYRLMIGGRFLAGLTEMYNSERILLRVSVKKPDPSCSKMLIADKDGIENDKGKNDGAINRPCRFR